MYTEILQKLQISGVLYTKQIRVFNYRDRPNKKSRRTRDICIRFISDAGNPQKPAECGKTRFRWFIRG